MTRQLKWEGTPVPYITPWSYEKVRWDPLVRGCGLGGEGLRYADEDPAVDRHMGVLRLRVSLARGKGEPIFERVHALRQVQAMIRMLCQVCGEPTYNPADERHLFLVRSGPGNPLREGETTASPPVHASCAKEAVQHCPPLRRGYTAALVKYASPWGVAGIAYDPMTLKPLPMKKKDLKLVKVPYTDDQRLRWVLAAREVVELRGVTPVDLDELLTTAA
ncbi:hypothetical protein [Streptomyces sp. bgisy153]|uniref:hypothetical protein n=1 Tax=Streptomyces sp. bgisy153 TaxID=3413793 RepID=UPI003D7486CE